MSGTESDELGRLRAENARLRALLAQHGIAADEPENMSPRKPVLSLEEKVTLFRSLFQGREDCLLGDGSAQRQARADTSQFAVGNGIGSFATRRNSNAPNVRTASFSHWDMMTFTITSKVKIRMGAMWSVSMRYFRIIPVASYAATSMTRIASMVIKRMLWHTSVFAATGEFRLI